MSEPVPLLQARHLAKSYRNRQVLQDLSMDVYPGETIGLLGSNGAGKTTCFYILAGLVQPSAGSVIFANEDITHLPIDRRATKGIGFLPQERSVFGLLSVLDNIRAVLEIQGRPAAEIEVEARRQLHEMGIEHLANAPADELSGGELRRVEIARALVLRPRLLLLDEPFAAIDPITVTELQLTLGKLQDSGTSLIISDHYVRETLSICNRGYILHGGRMLCSGTPQEIAANEQVRTHYLGKEFAL